LLSEAAEHPVASVLIAVYSVLLAWTFVLLVWLIRVDKRQHGKVVWRSRYVFLVLILLLTAVRIPNFVMILADPHNSDATESEKTWYFWALFNMAALLYLTIFTELILFWARLYDSMRPELVDGPSGSRWTDRQRRFVQAAVMTVAWLGYGAVFGTFFFLPFDTFFLIVSYVTSGFYAVTAVFFAVYGSLLYKRVLELPLRSAAVTSRIRRVMAVAATMTLAFLARAVLNAVLPSLIGTWQLSESDQWIVFTVTWISVEAIPLFLVEFLIIVPRRPAPVDPVREQYSNHYAPLN